MSDTTARTPGRRTVRFDTPAAVLADVAVLRRGCRPAGRWTLAQVCDHLASVVGGNLTPPPNDEEPTADQRATKAKFFGMINDPGGLPEGLPLAEPPGEACGEAEIDALVGAFDALAAYPHARLMVGRCGPVPVGEVRDIHLRHCEHHLSFLTPTTVRRAGLRYARFDDVAADVTHLRRGYVRSGNWTLPQACWHLSAVTRALLARPVGDPTPEMTARRPTLEAVLAGGPLPDGLPAPDELAPPSEAGEADVDAFLFLVGDLRLNPPGRAMHRLFGPLNGGQAVALFLAHCAHHLSYLVPVTGGV